MNDIFNLLNISSENLRDYSLQANLVIDIQTEKVINENVKHLKKIENAMYSDYQAQVPAQSVEDVILKVKRAATTKVVEVIWTAYELRILSNSMVQLQDNSEAFTYALFILESNWRNLFFNGLIFYIMNGWNNMPHNYREQTCKLIISQLNLYQGNNKRYLLLKNHANFFEENGPLRLSSLMKHRNESLSNAPLLIGCKPSTFLRSYYSDVIIYYLKDRELEDLSLVEELLAKHTLDRTKKLVFANLVEDADRDSAELKQTQISKLAFRILGDVSLSTTWAPFSGATLEEIEKLQHAKELVNRWYTKKVIEVFFDVCVQDPKRREFWLKYVNYITNFRISGSSAVKLSLNADYRISEMFENYFIETNSQKVKTAALIIYIKNKVFVEFSDTGALYIYNKDNSMVESLTKKHHINNISDLKNTSLPQAIDSGYYGYYYFSEEGHMRHAGNWTSRLDSWFNRILNISI